jgi:hypothetical protein
MQRTQSNHVLSANSAPLRENSIPGSGASRPALPWKTRLRRSATSLHRRPKLGVRPKEKPGIRRCRVSCDSRSCFTRRPSLGRLNTVFTLSCQQPTVTAFQLAEPEPGQRRHRDREPERRPEQHIPEPSAGRPEREHSRSAPSEHRLACREHIWRQEPHSLASRGSTCCRSKLCTDQASAD